MTKYLVGTWTFTNPDVPLTTALHRLTLGDSSVVERLDETAAAVYYGAVEPGSMNALLLHNDVSRSAMSRRTFAPDGSSLESGRWPSGGRGGSYVAFNQEGRYFAVANAHTGWAVFRNGWEPELLAVRSNIGSGPHPRQQASHPHCVLFSPNDSWIYAADMGTDEVLAFPFDAATGHLGETVVAHRARPGSGPRHLTFHGGLVYLLNELGNSIQVLLPGVDGTLVELQSLSTLPPGSLADSHTAHLGVSHDGRHIFATNRGHDSIAVFGIDDEGLLAPIDWVPSGGRWPWFFLLTDDSRMLVANNLSDNITIFDVGEGGRLTPTDTVAVPRPIFIAAQPVPCPRSRHKGNCGPEGSPGATTGQDRVIP